MVRWFFLFIHFLAVEDYEFVKSKSHIISGPLTQKCIKILSWSISLFFSTLIVPLMMFCVRLLSELMILLSTHHVTNHLTCSNKSRYQQYQKYRKMQFCIELYFDIWGIILYLQGNPYRLKTKNIDSLIFISTIIK